MVRNDLHDRDRMNGENTPASVLLERIRAERSSVQVRKKSRQSRRVSHKT